MQEQLDSHRVQIHLFGGVSAATDDGEPIGLGPAKCQAVLAALALSPGTAVTVSRLVEMVWGAVPPRTAEKTLQTYITRLRKGLGPESIVRSGAAYRLDVDPESVDVARFQRRLEQGDVAGALAEWTGTPLAGLDAEGVGAAVGGLTEQYLGAVESDLGRRIEADPPAAIAPLTELTANHPYREGAWALLMTALYRVGRQADALAAYRNARRRLVDELGVEPGPRLRELETLILEQDVGLGIDRASHARVRGLPSGTVTFGFSDVDGASRLLASHHEDAAAALERHEEIVRASADAHAGYVFSLAGDAFGVAFHRAADAAAWAAAVQAACAQEPWPGGLEVPLRVGLHTGETELRGRSYYGPAVNVAARIAAVGHGGQILASGVTSDLLERSDLRELGTFRLEDVVSEQRILQLGGAEHPPLRTHDGARGNLPRRTGRLVGREEELDAVIAALDAAPVVTLVGPGGIGKTRLALAAARAGPDRPGGGWLVELAEIAGSPDVPRAVADTLGVKESAGRTLLQSVVVALRARDALLVLDNCEHVVDGAAELTHAIAASCPEMRVLATSREGLGLDDEQIIAVGPLAPEGAGAELFNERALAADRSFDAESHRTEVAEICRRLDGVPLAIELAAARTRSLSPQDLVQRLDDRLRLLTGGRRTSLERHRTLRATIQWSYDLLAPPKRLLFQRLSVFAGPFDLQAAELVAADGDLDRVDVDDLLGGLVDRSMLTGEAGPFGRRFRLLETMRQFGAERLAEIGDTDRTAERHARWCLERVRAIGRLLAGPDELEGVARLGELWPNLRAAVDWASATEDLALLEALVRPTLAEIQVRNQSEIGDWAERILAMTSPDDEERLVFWLTWAAFRYTFSQEHDRYERLAERYGEPDTTLLRYARAFLYEDNAGLVEWGPRAVAELRRMGEDHLAETAEMGGYGQGLLGVGRFEEHEAFATLLAERYRAKGPPTLYNWALTMHGFAASLQGRHDEADRFFETAVAVRVPPGTLGINTPIEARAAYRQGDRLRAFTLLRDYVEEQLAADNMFMGRAAAVEFVNMMASSERLADAATMVGYLETTNFFNDAAGMRSLVAEADRAIAATLDANGERERMTGRSMGDREAFEYIRDVLERLVDSSPAA